jgi:hypothetical protein
VRRPVQDRDRTDGDLEKPLRDLLLRLRVVAFDEEAGVRVCDQTAHVLPVVEPDGLVEPVLRQDLENGRVDCAEPAYLDERRAERLRVIETSKLSGPPNCGCPYSTRSFASSMNGVRSASAGSIQ